MLARARLHMRPAIADRMLLCLEDSNRTDLELKAGQGLEMEMIRKIGRSESYTTLLST